MATQLHLINYKNTYNNKFTVLLPTSQTHWGQHLDLSQTKGPQGPGTTSASLSQQWKTICSVSKAGIGSAAKKLHRCMPWCILELVFALWKPLEEKKRKPLPSCFGQEGIKVSRAYWPPQTRQMACDQEQGLLFTASKPKLTQMWRPKRT